MRELSLILLSLLAVCALADIGEIIDEENDAVIIEVEKERNGRQVQWAQPTTYVLNDLTSTFTYAHNPCVTSKGEMGKCQTLSSCYTLYDISPNTPSWVFGSKDTCAYTTPEGKASIYGVCCVSGKAASWPGVLSNYPSEVQTNQNAAMAQWHRQQQAWQRQQNTWQQQQMAWQQQQIQRQWGSGGFPGAGGSYPQQGGYPQYPQYPQYPGAQQPGFPQQGGGHYPGQFPGGGFHPGGFPGQHPVGGGQGQYPQGGGGGHYPGGVPQAPIQVQQPQPPPQQIQEVEEQFEEEDEEDDDGDKRGDYSECGIGRNHPIQLNENGEVLEEVERLEGEHDLRIAGGWAAERNEWPWIVALFNNGRQFCGGSLISKQHILTAAHCIDHMTSSDVKKLTVRLGAHNLNTQERSTVNRRVELIIKNKKFSMRTLHDDIAILKLSSPVKFTSKIRKVCLATGSERFAGETATATGWGLLKENGQRPPVLQEITLKVWDNQKCKSVYGSTAPAGITNSMLCAGQKGRDSCSGDSGGTLVKAIGGKWHQIGIVSWGIGCGKAEFPGVYTRVTEMQGWIQKVLNNY